MIGHYFGLDAEGQDCKLSAVEYFRKCFELDPTNRQPFSDFGSFLYELQRYDEGISILLRSIELGDDEVYLLLGVLVLQLVFKRVIYETLAEILPFCFFFIVLLDRQH